MNFRQFFIASLLSGFFTATILVMVFYTWFKPNLVATLESVNNTNSADISRSLARQASSLDSSGLSTENDLIVEMVGRVNPAVVSIVVSKDMPIYEQYYENLDPWGMFTVPRTRENGSEEREIGGGSGFIASADGLVVTNRHVVNDEKAKYTVVMSDGTTYAVDILAVDSQLDVAVLKINNLATEVKLPFLSFGDSDNLRLGERVVAIGNALAEFKNSVSVGVVSGLSRSIVASDQFGKSESLDQVIQTDAAINPGNSGGPLLNLKGEVIGINVATSQRADNIGFALPASLVSGIVESVKEHGRIVSPFLGVRYMVIDEVVQKRNNLSVDYGVLIVRGREDSDLAVVPGSPADKAGLTENDIILAVDGEELRNRDLITILRSKEIGKEIALEVLQKGERKTLKATLIATPETPLSR